MHDRDPVAKPFGLVEIVRRDEDRHLEPLAERLDDVEQLGADARIEADDRLVEEQDARARHKRAGDLEAPSLAFAVRADEAFHQLAETESRRDLVDPPGALSRVDAPQAGVELEVPTAGQGAVDDRILEDDLLTARADSGCVATSKPASLAVPPVGRMVVVSIPTVVDFPAPFGPSSPNTSPAATSKSMPFTASTSPG
jgi:hypothetical protein